MPSKSVVSGAAALAAIITVVPAVASAAPAVPTQANNAPNARSLSTSQLRSLTPVVRPQLKHRRIDSSGGYQGQRRCVRGDRPGTRALKRLLHRVYDPSIAIGTHRSCRGDTSEHYDGRALDWMTNARNRRQAAQADAFVSWLIKKDRGVRGANARRLGIMYIIWRGRMWRAYSPGWRDYNGCSRGGGNPTACHRNHVHISLTWRGAQKRTSWYRR